MPQPPRDRKDHYVPQGYLRGFIDSAREKNDRPLWCLNKARNQWERKSSAQICHERGMYDFSNDALEAEHADVTFKSMEDGLKSIRDELLATSFVGWKKRIDFLLPYMQMMRVRSPLFLEEQGEELTTARMATITAVDHAANSLTHDGLRPMTLDEIHDHTLGKMRDEFKNGATWMAQFEWQIRTTFDPYNPVVTSESPLFVKGAKPQTERAMTMDLLTDAETEVYFPLCWQACLVGRVTPFEADVEPFAQSNLLELRHMVAEMAPEYVIAPQIVEDLVLDGRNSPAVATRK